MPRTCSGPCTKVVKFVTDLEIPANKGRGPLAYTEVDGYRHINIFVTFTQEEADEPPVDLGVMFAFDALGTMGARLYVNLEANVRRPQNTNFIEVSGAGSWHGSQDNMSSYVVRLPVMGPFVQVFVYNRAPIPRTASVWAYLVA